MKFRIHFVALSALPWWATTTLAATSLPEGAIILEETNSKGHPPFEVFEDDIHQSTGDLLFTHDQETTEDEIDNPKHLRSRNLANWDMSANALSTTSVMVSWESGLGWEFKLCWKQGTSTWNVCNNPSNQDTITAQQYVNWWPNTARINAIIPNLQCGTTYTLKAKRRWQSDNTRVTTKPCPPACPDPCPVGSFDGANCYMGKIPTTLFEYNGNHYYTPVGANYCPMAFPISWYDGANCYMNFPAGAQVFIWSGNYYYKPCP